MLVAALLSFVLLLSPAQVRPALRPAPPRPAAPAFFAADIPLDAMTKKQAVIETSMGTFVIQLAPEKAPNHVAYFMKLARTGAFEGTLFHRVIRYGIIQGGDPLTKDPAKTAQYGTGGLNQLKPEFTDKAFPRGTVAAVLAPGKPDSGGAQFFVCVSDQPLAEPYTIFGSVAEGMEVVEQISAVEANANGLPNTRIVITKVTIRDTPPPPVPPFSTETVDELAKYRMVIETTKGEIVLKVRPDLAPDTVRAVLRQAKAGVYDVTLFHRVVKGFVIQTGSPAYRDTPLTPSQQGLVKNLKPEFTPTPNLPGIVSMARGAEPDSATSSFFICTGDCRSLDGQYTVFAEVESGLDVVKAIEGVAVNGEAPIEPVKVIRITVGARS
jgi:cyclophilin family peptidyl-prolyl cis-trans isomerase